MGNPRGLRDALAATRRDALAATRTVRATAHGLRAGDPTAIQATRLALVGQLVFREAVLQPSDRRCRSCKEEPYRS